MCTSDKLTCLIPVLFTQLFAPVTAAHHGVKVVEPLPAPPSHAR